MVFALHRKAPTTKTGTICTTYSPNAENRNCFDYSVYAPVPGSSLVYVMVVRGGEQLLGATFGIDYDGRAGSQTGIDPTWTVFHPCFDGMAYYDDGGFGDFPAPRGGARVTWETCAGQRMGWDGYYTTIGALYVYAYSPDILRVTPNNNLGSGPELGVVTCNRWAIQLLEIWPPIFHDVLMGKVGFGQAGGYTCFDLPVEKATWGRVKAWLGSSGRTGGDR